MGLSASLAGCAARAASQVECCEVFTEVHTATVRLQRGPLDARWRLDLRCGATAGAPVPCPRRDLMRGKTKARDHATAAGGGRAWAGVASAKRRRRVPSQAGQIARSMPVRRCMSSSVVSVSARIGWEVSVGGTVDASTARAILLASATVARLCPRRCLTSSPRVERIFLLVSLGRSETGPGTVDEEHS